MVFNVERLVSIIQCYIDKIFRSKIEELRKTAKRRQCNSHFIKCNRVRYDIVPLSPSLIVLQFKLILILFIFRQEQQQV